MNQALTNMQSFVKEARKLTWRDIRITDKDRLRAALIMKHGSLTRAAENLNIPFGRLSAIVNGRENSIAQIAIIQSDLGLTDEQVLELWPLLKTWPKKSRIIA